MERLVAHHQLVFKFKNGASNSEYKDAVSFVKLAIADDITPLRRETTSLYHYFQQEIGQLVDLNLDYFPEHIVVTFVNHTDVMKTLARKEFKFACTSVKEPKTWTFEATKIDFICHVRNCTLGDESPPNKYLPIYVQNERMLKARSVLQLTPPPPMKVPSSASENHRTV